MDIPYTNDQSIDCVYECVRKTRIVFKFLGYCEECCLKIFKKPFGIGLNPQPGLPCIECNKQESLSDFIVICRDPMHEGRKDNKHWIVTSRG